VKSNTSLKQRPSDPVNESAPDDDQGEQESGSDL
jgi:hypothetical protein